jgi:hypothetical protein
VPVLATSCQHRSPLIWGLIVSTLIVCAAPVTLPGQTPGQLTGPLFEKLRWARLELVMGRLELRDIRRGQNRSITVNQHETGIREHISFRIDGNKLLLHYERQSPEGTLVLDANGRRTISVRQTPATADKPTIQFHQDAKQVRLLVGDDDSQQYMADHLWLLLLQHPAPCRSHLVPLLESLRQDWHFGRSAEAVESNLVRAAGNPLPMDANKLHLQIDKLGHGTFRQRQAADMAIRKMGQPVVGYLSELDDSQLNAEQRLRLRRICASLLHRHGDSTLSVTIWLQSSPSAWLCMMQHEDATVRGQAQLRLATLLGRPVPFDPADPADKRASQIASIREKLLR